MGEPRSFDWWETRRLGGRRADKKCILNSNASRGEFREPEHQPSTCRSAAGQETKHKKRAPNGHPSLSTVMTSYYSAKWKMAKTPKMAKSTHGQIVATFVWHLPKPPTVSWAVRFNSESFFCSTEGFFGNPTCLGLFHEFLLTTWTVRQGLD